MTMFAVVIQHDFGLLDVELDAAALFAHGFENVRQLRKQENHVFDVRVFFAGFSVAVQDLRHFRIGHAVRRTNDRLRRFRCPLRRLFCPPA